MITPHGGQLVNRVLDKQKKQEVLNKAKQLNALVLNKEQITDVKNIANGVYSPLTGFLKEENFLSVVENMRLANGIVWPIPIVLALEKQDADRLKGEKTILLTDQNKKPIAVLENPEFYTYDKNFFVKNVFQTDDKKHPGAQSVEQMADYLAGGEIGLIDETKDVFPEYNFTPEQTRRIFEQKDWQTIVAFQTRNVPHRGHEFLQKHALQQIDGLFVQPVVGEKKLADFKDEFILGSYRLILDSFYPKNKTLLGILPLKMRYAGPREAVFHALIRKNFGCTHFIVGRDHAGTGSYYGHYDSQNIFDQFDKQDIGIEILKYPQVVWCPLCSEFVFENSCPHSAEIKMVFSGSKIRQELEDKKEIPATFMRPEVYNLLKHSLNPFIDDTYNMQQQNNQKQQGFVLWFTGIPCSGKSSIAQMVFEQLKQKGNAVERLDGDIVRQSLTKDLGFTKEDRDENIRRVGFVAKCLSNNKVGVIASFISPYRHQRYGVRNAVDNFIEVFCKCPLEVCEQRDIKGMYVKAKKGEIKNFTGISDPYEEPENPEILLKTDQQSIEESVEKVMEFLKEKQLI